MPTVARNLPFLFETVGKMSCADFHDKVYGVLGLIAGSESFPFSYEYSVADLVINTVLYCPSEESPVSDRDFIQPSQGIGDILHRLTARLGTSVEQLTIHKALLSAPQAIQMEFALGKIVNLGNTDDTEWPPSDDEIEDYYAEDIQQLIGVKWRKHRLFKAGDAIFRTHRSNLSHFDQSLIYVIVVRLVQIAARVVARVLCRIRGFSRLDISIEDYDDTPLQYLPGASIIRNEDWIAMGFRVRASSIPGEYCLQIDNTSTSALLFDLPEDRVLRPKCVKVMISQLHEWQQRKLGMESKLSSSSPSKHYKAPRDLGTLSDKQSPAGALP